MIDEGFKSSAFDDVFDASFRFQQRMTVTRKEDEERTKRCRWIWSAICKMNQFAFFLRHVMMIRLESQLKLNIFPTSIAASRFVEDETISPIQSRENDVAIGQENIPMKTNGQMSKFTTSNRREVGRVFATNLRQWIDRIERKHVVGHCPKQTSAWRSLRRAGLVVAERPIGVQRKRSGRQASKQAERSVNRGFSASCVERLSVRQRIIKKLLPLRVSRTVCICSTAVPAFRWRFTKSEQVENSKVRGLDDDDDNNVETGRLLARFLQQMTGYEVPSINLPAGTQYSCEDFSITGFIAFLQRKENKTLVWPDREEGTGTSDLGFFSVDPSNRNSSGKSDSTTIHKSIAHVQKR